MAIAKYEPEPYISILRAFYQDRLNAKTLNVLEGRLNAAGSTKGAHRILSVADHIASDLRYHDLQGSIEQYLRKIDAAGKIPIFYSQSHPSINEAILYLKEEAGLSASELSRRSGANIESVFKLKSGRKLQSTTIARLLDVFLLYPADTYSKLLELHE